MFFIIGGASRAGKTTVAAALERSEALPVLHLDDLWRGVCRFLEPAEMLDESVTIDVARATALSAASKLLQRGQPLIVEGGWITPRHCSLLKRRHREADIRTVFLGYPQADPRERALRLRHSKDEHDWLAQWPFEKAVEYLALHRDVSRWYESECKASGEPFLDTSDGLASALPRTADMLKVEHLALENTQFASRATGGGK